MTLMGKEDQINAMLIKLYNFLKTVCSADDLSRIDTHLLFTYMNYEELRYDEKNLQLFRATFPEVGDEYLNILRIWHQSSQKIINQSNRYLVNIFMVRKLRISLYYITMNLKHLKYIFLEGCDRLED